MPDYLRVIQKDTGHELSVTKSQYDFNPSAFDKVDGDATGPDGEPLAPKFASPKKAAASAKKEA